MGKRRQLRNCPREYSNLQEPTTPTPAIHSPLTRHKLQASNRPDVLNPTEYHTTTHTTIRSQTPAARFTLYLTLKPESTPPPTPRLSPRPTSTSTSRIPPLLSSHSPPPHTPRRHHYPSPSPHSQPPPSPSTSPSPPPQPSQRQHRWASSA